MPKGGRRPGAGRPRKGAQAPKVTLRAAARAAAMDYLDRGADPLKVLLKIAFDPLEPSGLRVQAATAAAQFMHPKLTATAVAQASVTAPINSGAVLDKLMARLSAMERPAIEAPAAPDGEDEGSAP